MPKKLDESMTAFGLQCVLDGFEGLKTITVADFETGKTIGEVCAVSCQDNVIYVMKKN